MSSGGSTARFVTTAGALASAASLEGGTVTADTMDPWLAGRFFGAAGGVTGTCAVLAGAGAGCAFGTLSEYEASDSVASSEPNQNSRSLTMTTARAPTRSA